MPEFIIALGFFSAGCAAGFALGWWLFVPSARRTEQRHEDVRNHIEARINEPWTDIPECTCGVGFAPYYNHSPQCPLNYLVTGGKADSQIRKIQDA